jgi:pimeloyl-ACP methyl ester carboxylesterase
MTALTHRRFTTSGAELHLVEAGQGPLVVLLHGFPESWFSWRHQLEPLAAAGYHVVAPDLRGYNESSKPAEVDDYRIERVVEDIVELIEKTEKPCRLVAHDWGGVVAWFLAMTRPELVSKLVILNSPHPVPYARELRRRKEQKLRATYQLLFAMPVVGNLFVRAFLALMPRAANFTAGELRTMREMWRKPGAIEGMKNYYTAMMRHRSELRKLVRPIDIPTLLIWGERDPVFIRATTEDFGDYVPNLRVERIAKAGHFVQTDAPERVNELLIEFLG